MKRNLVKTPFTNHNFADDVDYINDAKQFKIVKGDSLYNEIEKVYFLCNKHKDVLKFVEGGNSLSTKGIEFNCFLKKLCDFIGFDLIV